jgi:mono/diheme cytochrome c family protein
MDRYSAGSRRGLHRIVLPVALVTVGFLEADCYPKVAPPPGALSSNSVASASTRWPGVTVSSLSHGRDLFLANCNACHGYPDLAAISEERWPDIVEKMAKKISLSTEDRDAVLHFVLASRSEQGAR